jgi:hypothetical protein
MSLNLLNELLTLFAASKRQSTKKPDTVAKII